MKSYLDGSILDCEVLSLKFSICTLDVNHGAKISSTSECLNYLDGI